MAKRMQALAVVALHLSLQGRSEGRVLRAIDGQRQKLSDEFFLKERRKKGINEPAPTMKFEMGWDNSEANIRPIFAMASNFTRSEKDAIVLQHNNERTKTGGNDMLSMTWDEELANLAQGLTDTCEFQPGNEWLPGGSRVGQNNVMSDQKNVAIDELVQDTWLRGREHYDIQSGKCKNGEDCGSYTTMIWSETDKVGCGKTICSFGIFLACDYSPPPDGNSMGKKAVHLGGAPCSKCNLKPGTRCNAGLCESCNTPGQANCRAYDTSKCFDAKVDKEFTTLEGCSWALKYCSMAESRSWLERNCAKTCGFC